MLKFLFTREYKNKIKLLHEENEDTNRNLSGKNEIIL